MFLYLFLQLLFKLAMTLITKTVPRFYFCSVRWATSMLDMVRIKKLYCFLLIYQGSFHSEFSSICHSTISEVDWRLRGVQLHERIEALPHEKVLLNFAKIASNLINSQLAAETNAIFTEGHTMVPASHTQKYGFLVFILPAGHKTCTQGHLMATQRHVNCTMHSDLDKLMSRDIRWH